MLFTSKLQQTLILTGILLINMLGIFNPLFSGDSALYAVISKSFYISGNWSDIIVKSYDWLDKPHFPFWAVALGFSILGKSVITYKLVSFAFYSLGLWFTYKLAKHLYNQKVAVLSIIILSCAFHIVISNNDVRAETFLIGTLVPALYYVVRLYQKFSIKHLLLGALFSACAIMTKGIFIAIPLVGAALAQAIIHRQYKKLIAPYWLLFIVITLLFTAPELYTLYVQFDLHPDKVVFGETGVSGIQFFLWDSQFGRFFNNGPIKGKGEPSFFLHTLLWAFAPWAILAYTSLYTNIKLVFQSKKVKTEFFLAGAFISMFAIFSLSKFQLPHYTNIIFPFLSILTARYILTFNEKYLKAFKWIHFGQTVIFLSLLLFLHFYFKPGKNIWALATFILIGTPSFYFFFSGKNRIRNLIIPNLLVACIFGLYMNTIFYPKVLSYQNGIESSVYANTYYKDKVVYAPFIDNYLYVFEFFFEGRLVRYKNAEFIPPANSLMFLDQAEYNRVKQQLNDKAELLKTFSNFRITKMNGKFLNPETREKSLTPYYLIHIKN